MSGPTWEELQPELDRERARRMTDSNGDLAAVVINAMRNTAGDMDSMATAAIAAVLDDLAEPSREMEIIGGNMLRANEMPDRIWQAMLTAKRKEMNL